MHYTENKHTQRIILIAPYITQTHNFNLVRLTTRGHAPRVSHYTDNIIIWVEFSPHKTNGMEFYSIRRVRALKTLFGQLFYTLHSHRSRKHCARGAKYQLFDAALVCNRLFVARPRQRGFWFAARNMWAWAGAIILGRRRRRLMAHYAK